MCSNHTSPRLLIAPRSPGGEESFSPSLHPSFISISSLHHPSFSSPSLYQHCLYAALPLRSPASTQPCLYPALPLPSPALPLPSFTHKGSNRRKYKSLLLMTSKSHHGAGFGGSSFCLCLFSARLHPCQPPRSVNYCPCERGTECL